MHTPCSVQTDLYGNSWSRLTEFGEIAPPGGVYGTSSNDVWVSLTDGRMLRLPICRVAVACWPWTCPTLTGARESCLWIPGLAARGLICPPDDGGSGKPFIPTRQRSPQYTCRRSVCMLRSKLGLTFFPSDRWS